MPMTSFSALRVYVRLRERLALISGTDVEGTEQRIEDGIPVRGERAWLLVCSCLLASIGLDVGSAAVIIGAMLISPLMSPILGVGLSVAIADRALLTKAVRELALATLVTLVVSTLYFMLSPLAEPTAEEIARTTPTLLDVGVALFGGIAGIVAGSRRDQSLALPGVAIATALMPPLCTAGFGLATGRPAFFFGALYLYVINAIFIALATFVIARFLQFPLRTFTNPESRLREIRIVGIVAAVAVLPSLWFLYTTVTAARERRRVDQFLTAEVAPRGGEVLRWENVPSGDSINVKIYLAGQRLESATVDSLRLLMPGYGLERIGLEVVQSDISARDLERLQTDVQSGMSGILKTLELKATSDSIAVAEATRAAKPVVVSPLDTAQMRIVAAEMASAFPEFTSVAYAPQSNLLAQDSVRPLPTLFVEFERTVRTTARADLLTRAEALVRTRLKTDSIRVISR
jgi:uncharacterized hydrophobic protein (TIGR00271 family)